jgi:hypothetical protein
MNLKEYYKELLNEAYAAKTQRLARARSSARMAAKGQTYRGVANTSAAAEAADRDYLSADAGRMRSVRRRSATTDTIRDAAVALAPTPSDRADAENEAVARLRSRGLAGGAPELRAAALAGRRPSGPNLRALIAKARQMYDGVEPI